MTKSTVADSPSKASLVLTILGVIILLVGWWSFTQLLGSPYQSPDVPHPLGERLEYIGKEDNGCTGFCDSAPSSTYYYATDMSVEEVARYFKKATIENPEDINPKSSSSVPRTFSLKASNGDNFYITYHYNGREYISTKEELKQSNKPCVFSILDEQYNTAKDSL